MKCRKCGGYMICETDEDGEIINAGCVDCGYDPS